MSEASARSSFIEKLKKWNPNCDVQRIEDKFSAGIPDINTHVPGYGDWWIEAKALKEYPKRLVSFVQIGLRREQVIWLERRKRAGGQVLVLVRVGRIWAVFDNFFKTLEEGCTQIEFEDMAKWLGKDLDFSAIFAPQDVFGIMYWPYHNRLKQYQTGDQAVYDASS